MEAPRHQQSFQDAAVGSLNLDDGSGEARDHPASGRANGTAYSNGVQDDMAWNSAPIYLPVSGATLLVRPPAPADLREAWLLIR